MLKKILIGGAVALAALVVVIAVQPDTFHIERSIDMAAPPEAAFAQVNDFHAWRAWSPWEKLDANMHRSYAGPAQGVGAQYAWVSRSNAGEGRMTIEQSRISHIGIKLEFIKPFASTSAASFHFEKTAEGCKTTWSMDGHNNFIAKALGLVMNVDELVGADFERGLQSMKNAAEGAGKTPVAAAAP